MNKTDIVRTIVNVLEARMEAGMPADVKQKIRQVRKGSPRKPDPTAQGQSGSVAAMANLPRNKRGARFSGFLTQQAINKARKREDSSTKNFIGNTVEILMERIKANKAAKNAWMASQPTDPDDEPKIPKRYKSEAGEDVEGSVQFNAVRRSQHNVPADSKVQSGAGDSGKPFDPKSKLTAARTVQKHTPNPLGSAVNARNNRNKKASQARRDRTDASHQNFIEKTVEILAERLIGNQKKLDVNKSGNLDAKDFKMLRKGKRKGKRKDEAIKIDTSPGAEEKFQRQRSNLMAAFKSVTGENPKAKPTTNPPTPVKKPKFFGNPLAVDTFKPERDASPFINPKG